MTICSLVRFAFVATAFSFFLCPTAQVRVAGVQPEKRKMRLSLRLSVPDDVVARGSEELVAGPLSVLPPGTLVDGVVSALAPPVSPDRVVVRVTHYYRRVEGEEDAGLGSSEWERVRVPRASDAAGAREPEGDDDEDDTGVFAELPLIQLSDCRPVSGSASAAGAAAISAIVPGTLLRGLLVLQRLSAKRHAPPVASASPASSAAAAALAAAGPPRLLLSGKPILCAAARAAKEMIPTGIELVRAGLPVVGYIASVTAFGAFVRFLDGCTGLCPRSKWPKHLTEPSLGGGTITREYAVGDSVIAVVDAVLQPDVADVETTRRSRFTLSLLTGPVSKALPRGFLAGRVGTVNDPPFSLAASSLRSWLLDDEACRCAAAGGSNVPARAAFPLGARMVARVDAVARDSASVQLRLPAPPPEYQTPAASSDFPAIAVGSSNTALAPGGLVLVQIVDVTGESVLVVILGPAPAPAVAGSSTTPSKKKSSKVAGVSAPQLPRYFNAADVPQIAPSSLHLGSQQEVEVSLSRNGLHRCAVRSPQPCWLDPFSCRCLLHRFLASPTSLFALLASQACTDMLPWST
jgi:hypothetical protein